jgi:putative DNA primase/helicase
MGIIQSEFAKQFSTVPSIADLAAIRIKLGVETSLLMTIHQGKCPQGIPVLDGILNLETLKTTPYEPHFYQFKRISYPYSPLDRKTYYPDKFIDFLCSSLEINRASPTVEGVRLIRYVQEWMGYTLTNYNIFEKCLIMVGGGRNGKGVLMKLWTKMLGEHNVSFVDLGSLHDKQLIAKTKNKMANFAQDLSKSVQLDREEIKRAISCEMMEVNEKYKPSYEFRFCAKLIVLTNTLPYLTEFGASITERFQVLPFRKSFTGAEGDPYLLKRLEKEVPQIFAWAIEGLKALMKRGAFDLPERVSLALKSYLQSQDVVTCYLDDYGLTCQGANAPLNGAYADYRKYCSESGHKALSSSRFADRLTDLNYRISLVGRVRVVHDLVRYQSPEHYSFLEKNDKTHTVRRIVS